MQTIAFYLPQFHPIPENDAWWGAGFTEWRNVAASKPRFWGHYQPHLPADLGFYDLRLPQALAAQGRLAREYGLSGFNVYHYWFNGHLLLERPLEVLLDNEDIDFPFMICWANENWTRRWDGKEQELLITQDYANYDPKEHMAYLTRLFADPRYLTKDGRPVISVYDATVIPDFPKVVEAWRAEAVQAGFPDLVVLAVARDEDFDRNLLQSGTVQGLIDFTPTKVHPERASRATNLRHLMRLALTGALSLRFHRSRNRLGYSKLLSYKHVMNEATKTELKAGHFPCAMPSWDNSPRRASDSTVIQNTNPALFESWLRRAADQVRSVHGDDGYLFINAWNEWAEGCHLEPDLRIGRGWLEAVRRALKS